MRDVTITLEGLTAYSASRPLTVEKEKGESHDDFEKRIWREKAHCDEDENVFIPGVGFKLALDETAKLLKEKIKGKGSQTYGGLFSTGCAAVGDLHIGVKKSALKALSIYANADGRRGGGTRVTRYFPYVPTWAGSVAFRIFNDHLPPEVFERYFVQAGLTAGVGRGRPSMGCPAGNGRFRPTAFAWGNQV
jgi:hypothetical protein